MFVLELGEHPGYYVHKNSGSNTKDQFEGLIGNFSGGVRTYTNILENAKVFTTSEKAGKEKKRVQGFWNMGTPHSPPTKIKVVEVFMISERELAETPMLQKAFDDFRLTQKLSAR